MYAFELFEAGKPRVIVTYPGRFQPFHQGHAAVYAQLQKKFGRDNVYILTSNDTSGPKSPFSFSDKYQLMTAAGVPGDRIIETTNMYALPEGFDKASTIFVAAVGEPDKKRLNPDSALKKDKKDAEGNVIKPAGSPGYFMSFDRPEPKVTSDQHGYVIVIPEVKKTITIKGQQYDVSHGTECRNLWNSIRNDQKARVEFLTQLYGQASSELAHIFDKIPAMAEDVAPISQDTTSPIHGGITESVLNENEEYILYLNGKPSAQYTDTGRLKADLMHLKKKYPNLQYEIRKEVCKEVPVTGVAEDAAGVGVVAKNKKMAKDPRYSMSITQDVKPETPKNMLRAFRLSEQGIDPADFEIRNFEKLDSILLNCCEMVVEGQKENSKLYGMVAACVVDPENRMVYGVNTFDDATDSRKHAERVAIENYTKRYGDIPKGSIIVTTLSPCCHPMDERYGESCTDLINASGVHKVYCGYKDPTQEPEDKMFHVMCSRNEKINAICKKFADTFLDEGIAPYGRDQWGQPEMPDDFKPASYVYPGIIRAYKVAKEKGMKVVRSEGGRFKLAPLSDPSPELIPNPKLPDVKQKVQQELDKLKSIADSVGKTISLRDFVKQYGGYGVLYNKMAKWNKVLKDTPTFIEKPTTIKENEHSVSERQMMRMVKRFMHLAAKELKLSKVPHIVIQPHIEAHDGQATFGRFVNEEEKIYLGIADRHPVDILRTLAHELVHFKQYEQGRMKPNSGETGSPIENEAHAMAGVLMRHFNKKYPDAIKSKPLELDNKLDEKWSEKYKSSINCSNPKGFSQKAHCAGRKKNESTIKEFAPNDSDDNDDILFRYAKMWYNSGMPAQQKIEIILNRAGWEIGELESEEGGAFVVKSDDEHGDSYIGWSAEELTDIKENFADGRNPQDKGDSKRYNVPTKGSISSLRKIAKQGGRRGQLAHWMANMKSGKKKND